jgi:hypothetical protein
LGAKPEFEIRSGYKHRQTYSHFDDTSFKDEWQSDVYIRAAKLMQDEQLCTVHDVGCGSGYKLIRYLGDYDTTGFEVPDTLEFLQRSYPERKWKAATPSDSQVPAELVICSDVIEHVLDPEVLIRFLISLTHKWLLISTPDRGILYSRTSAYQLGPPRNPDHVREWNFNEFHRFVERYVDIKEHFICNRDDATQVVIATRRKPLCRPSPPNSVDYNSEV